VVLCTTYLKVDKILRDIGWKNDVLVYRGSVNDKLLRWKKAADKFNVEFFVTFDGDDLLCEPTLANLAFDQFDRGNADFIEAKNVPCGAFTYGIKTAALNKVCEIKASRDTEMMEPYFTKTGLFTVEQLENVPPDLKRPELRMTMDYPEDLTFFDKIYQNFNDRVSLIDVIAYLDDHPEIIAINRHCQQKYLDNQKRLEKIKLKGFNQA